MRNYEQGRYTLRNPDKYIGNPNNVVYRSSWEKHMNEFLDTHGSVLQWSSEEIAIPYRKPTDGRVHRYYPDYYIKYRGKGGKIKRAVVEVKPEAQTKPPKARGKNKKTQMNEKITYAVNVAKWKAAAAFCKQKGVDFKIVTETTMFK